jgi:hypothetical protein
VEGRIGGWRPSVKSHFKEMAMSEENSDTNKILLLECSHHELTRAFAAARASGSAAVKDANHHGPLQKQHWEVAMGRRVHRIAFKSNSLCSSRKPSVRRSVGSAAVP